MAPFAFGVTATKIHSTRSFSLPNTCTYSTCGTSSNPVSLLFFKNLAIDSAPNLFCNSLCRWVHTFYCALVYFQILRKMNCLKWVLIFCFGSLVYCCWSTFWYKWILTIFFWITSKYNLKWKDMLISDIQVFLVLFFSFFIFKCCHDPGDGK